ncbi:MAG: xanthine dehydrogenase family protein subunit M [Thermodesulfobacteriota bacterium]
MKAFDYERPASFEEAGRMLAEAGGNKKALAGGTDLLIKMRRKAIAPQGLVSLRDVPALSFIEFDADKGLSVGAMTKLADLESSSVVKEHYSALAAAVATIGSIQVRHRATLGGNVCNAAPSADSPPILIAFGASGVIGGPGGERAVLLEKFFTGPGQTVLKPGELLKYILVPPPPKNSFGVYFKAARSTLDIALVGVALAAEFEPGGPVVKDLKVVLGAVAPTPLRALALEGVVRGKVLDDDLIEQAVAAACVEACPITDVRSSEDYRNELVQVYARRALQAAKSWAEKGGVR